jgi:serine/threonine-protein kinase
MYPQVFGKYVLERELARGGMARVVLATLRGAGGFEKKLVVKQIRDELACDDDFVRRFVEEAKTTVALAHPNIVPVYELGVELGTYFLAMEFVEGLSVAELLRARRRAETGVAPLSPEEGAYVGVELCRALDYAHRRMNVVHRDVTPRNVMVDEEGQVKVIDFGIAAPVATAPRGHGVFGSPGHMPPEQMEARELTPAADVFAVAVLLMELWTGKAPFRRSSNEEIESAMRAPHPRPSDADVRLLPLDEIIASAMSVDPKERPQQADDLGRALRKFLAGVDLGDVARELGDRVRAVRANPPEPARPEDKPVLQRPPSRPTATQVGTRTFAAREEVRRLSRPPDDPATRRLESGRPPPAVKEEESVATRPLESGPRRERPPPRRRRAWLASVALALVAAGFFVARGGRQGTTSSSTSTSTSTSSPTSTLTPTAASNATPAATPPSNAPGPATSSESSSDPTGPPELTLLGDGAQVTVDGTARGRCPARLALDPGPHTVLFSFPATGESKGQSLTLHAGERITLRADFTRATPTIRVQH